MLLVAALGVLPARAHVVRVPQDAASIQAGIDAAAHGDTVLVQCGTYYEHEIVLKSGVVILSESGDPSCVEVTANSQGRAFIADSVEDVVLQGLRITWGVQRGVWIEDSRVLLRDVELTNNRARGALFCLRSEVVLDNVTVTGNYSYEWGGGVDCRGTLLTIRESTFTNNEAGYEEGTHSEGHGGAIHAREGSALDVQDTVFERNVAWVGGGAVYLDESDGLFVGCEFADNEGGLASWTYNATGGGMAAIDGSLDVISSTFMYNTGLRGGGMELKWGCEFSLDDVVFVGNTASSTGGGFYGWECGGASELARCTFEGNAAEAAGGCYIGDMVCSLSECVFVGNSADEGASGALLNAEVEVTGCTFYGNSSPGGCIEVEWSVPVTIANTIVSGTLLGSAVLCSEDSSLSTYQSCVHGNAGGDSLCGDHHDNLFVDPLFCSPQTGDLSLCSDSPCLAENTTWGELVGALGVGCPACGTHVEGMSWGCIKAMFR